MDSKKLILIAIVILGFFIKAAHINSFGIWNDEQATVLISQGETRYFLTGKNSITSLDLDRFTNIQRHAQNTLPNIVRATINDNGNSFAYNLLLHYWIAAFGKNDLSVRLLALMFGLLIIPFAYRFSLLLFKNKNASLVIALLFAIHPLFMEYSMMCRAYTMGTFFSLLSSYLFYRIITSQADNKTYLFYALSVGISLLTHYLTSYVFIAHGIIFLLSVRDKTIWTKYIVAGLLVIAIFGSWMYAAGSKGFKILKYQNENSKLKAQQYKPGDTGEAAFTLPPTPKNILTGWVEVWLQLFSNQLKYWNLRIRMISVLLILPFFLIVAMIRQQRRDPAALKIIIGLLIMTFTQTLYATAESLRSGHCKPFHPLYSNFAVPYALILLGYAIYTCYQRSNLKMITIIFTSAIFAITVASYIPTYRNAREIYPAKNFHQISAGEIVKQYRKGDTVSIKTNIDAKLINLYLPDNIEIDQKIDSNITGLYAMPKR